MTRALYALSSVLLISSAIHADGCKFSLNGRLVPEREQHAMIEWAEGIETLHVAAFGDPTSEGHVWIVPIRALPGSIQAEPVDEMPVVGFYQTLKSKAGKSLDDWLNLTAALNSGGLCCPMAKLGCDDKKSSVATETSRVERLGMIVTVVACESRQDMEDYLKQQGINRHIANLASLEPYFGKRDFGFVCGWVAKAGVPAAATGMKIVFPSSNFWFPLRPTQAYTNEVETVIYAKGFVKPAETCEVAGLRCEYVYGHLENQGVHSAAENAKRWEQQRQYVPSREPLTRIHLTTDTKQWSQDLELVPGTTFEGSANRVIAGWMVFDFGWNAILGALLGLLLPTVTIIRSERTWLDYGVCALVGASIVMSLWVLLIAFAIWRSTRFGVRFSLLRNLGFSLAFAVVHFLLVLGIYLALQGLVVEE